MNKNVFRILNKPPQLWYAIGLGSLMGRLVLLLTTTGRKTGKPLTTSLQYEQIDGCYYVASWRGINADWVKNIKANPRVELRVKNKQIKGQGKIVTNPDEIANFIAYRLERRPRFIGRILKAHDIPIPPTHQDLVEYSKERAMVVIKPEELA